MDNKNKYKESEIFRVPENYFEELTDKMTGITEAQGKKPGPGFFTIARPHLMLAASMVLLVIISYATLKFLLPDIQNDEGGYDSNGITEYLAEEMDETTLLENIDLADIYSIASGITETDQYEDEIIDYLIEENINYEDILENL